MSLARQRQGLLACVAMGVVLAHVTVNTLLGKLDAPSSFFATATICCSTAVLLFALAKNLSNWAFSTLAFVFATAHAWVMSLYEHTLIGARPEELSLVMLQVLALPLVVPLDKTRLLFATVGAAVAQPVVATGLAHAGLLSATDFGLARSWLGAAITTAIALAVHDFVLRIRRDTLASAGRYELLTKIGEGGMGEVWEAKHRFLARPAAIKILRRRRDVPGEIARFEREARSTALLTSVHTVQLYDYGVTDDGRKYYAMELLNGFDLKRLVEGSGPLAPARLVYIVDQICDSVAEAHRAGLVHRDLKPANIFVGRLGGLVDFVKVLDFGLVYVREAARRPGRVDLITSDGEITGTPAYFPPELASGKDADERSDIYQIGCVMFFALTGKQVFDRADPWAMITAHATLPPPRPSESVAGVPKDLDDLVVRCLDKSPDARPQTILELDAELRKLECYDQWTQAKALTWWDHFAVAQEPSHEMVSRKLANRERAESSSSNRRAH